jgi:hypothetical protein
MTSPARLDSAGVKAAAAKAKVDWPRLQRDLKTVAPKSTRCSRAPIASPGDRFQRNAGVDRRLAGRRRCCRSPTCLVAEARKTCGALTMPGPLNRRQLAGLGAVVVGGWAVGQVLWRTAPIGRDVGPTADLILAGNGSPEDGLPMLRSGLPCSATIVARLAVTVSRAGRGCAARRQGAGHLQGLADLRSTIRTCRKRALACAEQGFTQSSTVR